MNEIEKIPKDYHSITPALIVKNGDEAIEFYKNGFGVEERCCMKGRMAGLLMLN
jgi:PhnB protein